MELIPLVVVLLLGVAIGAWAYRYALKRSPEAVERLAAQARRLGDRF